jgi:hypothetical protein
MSARTSRCAIARGLALALLALAGAGSVAQTPAGTTQGAAAYREIRWDDLIPKDWDPLKDMRAKGAAASVIDGSPQAQQRMRELREIWDNAPTIQALHGQAVRLPGYVVPLEESKEGLKEFLLVPYFGACIHTPPPPANQIVHVVTAKPVKGFAAMDTVWVDGTMKLSRQDSQMGVSGYRMEAALVARYTAPPR